VLQLLRPPPAPPADPIVLATAEDVIALCLNPAVPPAAVVPILRLAQELPVAVTLAELVPSA
jgi:hypothetical protein